MGDEGVEYFSELSLCSCHCFVNFMLPSDEVFVKWLIEEMNCAVSIMNCNVLKRHSNMHSFILTSIKPVSSAWQPCFKQIY